MEDKEQELLEGEETVTEPLKKKKIKKKKSKEERIKDRKVIFLVLVITVVAALGFYIWPMIKNKTGVPKIHFKLGGWNLEAPEWKGYSETQM